MRMFIVENKVKSVEEFILKTGHQDYLVSYHYLTEQMLRQINNLPGPKVSYLLDSGAFSAYTQNLIIENSSYIQFAQDNRSSFFRIFALDEIGNAEMSRQNYDDGKLIIQDLIPCFHKGEPWEYLHHYC